MRRECPDFSGSTLTALCVALPLAACSSSPAVNDTGSMAYPASAPTGQFQRSGRSGSDTGSMSYPAPGRPGYTTQPGSTSGAPDTGSMGYPAPLPSSTLPAK
jgi:hypothetical protein